MLDAIETAFDEQRAALEAREQSEAKLRRFVADASHELRTPLTTVRGYAELYGAGGLDDPEELDRAMARIDGESRRMSKLTEDLLLLARLDQGRPLAQERVDLSRLVSEAVTDLSAIEPERPVSASIQPGVEVLGDEDRLRQVVGNLVTNVRVHTPTGTAVEVDLAVTDGRSRLRVVDHGPGIDDVHAGRIFDRFFRADPARSRDKGGSGLGLAIASSVLAVQGGSIGHTATPGGGATFTVVLPLAPPLATTRAEPG
jgi:two-component system OmpR family sensor kinase